MVMRIQGLVGDICDSKYSDVSKYLIELIILIICLRLSMVGLCCVLWNFRVPLAVQYTFIR